VVDVWRHADRELEPQVREARAGLERLAAESTSSVARSLYPRP
jgi:hypothetical protein